MQSGYILQFALARPFRPFAIFLSDGRRINVPHPETLAMEQHVEAFWFSHKSGQLEIIDAGSITGLLTLEEADTFPST